MSESAADLGQIRIVIRDAKPPLPARIIQTVISVLCGILIIAACALGLPRLFGVQEFNVLTGSMSPELPPGTLVYVMPKEPAAIRPGEIVSFVMNEDLDVATHRVLRNDYDGKHLVTKGDANANEDDPIMYENVVGVVAFSVPYVGGLFDYVANDSHGRVVGIAVLLSVIVLAFAADMICSALTRQKVSVQDTNKPSKSKAGERQGEEAHPLPPGDAQV